MVRIRHVYLCWKIWKGKCIYIYQVCCAAIFLWANWRTEIIVLLCLCSHPSHSLDILQPRIYLSVPQLALAKCYSHFSGAGRELWTTRVHTGRQCKNRHWASILLSHSIGTLTTEPNFLLLEPGQDTEMYSFGKGGGEPLYPFLILFLFWRGQLQFSCRARLYKLDDKYPQVFQHFLKFVRGEFQTKHRMSPCKKSYQCFYQSI